MKLNFKGFTKDQLSAFAESATAGSGTRFFKVQDGTSKIRFFVSPNESNPSPFYPTYQHWITGTDGRKYSILCTHRTPNIEEKPCPICSKVAEYYNSDNVEMVRVAKDTKPNLSFLQWGFVKGPKDTDWRSEPSIVAIPKTVMTMITEVCTMEDDYVDLYSYDVGHFLNISRKKDAGTNLRYVYTVLPATSKFDVSVDPWKDKVEATVSILDIMGYPTEEDQKKAVADIEASVTQFLTDGSAEEDDEDNMSSVREQLGSFSEALNS
jgi:hypothetical protein